MKTELTDDQITSLLGKEMISSDEDFTRFARLIIAADRAQRQAVPPARSSDRAVMQMALDVLIDSMDSVNNAHIDAVNMYSNYPSLQRRITTLENDVNKHTAAITALQQAIAQPEHPTEIEQLREQNTALDLRCAEYERSAQTGLQLLVHKVHAAKGRHHTQIAMCDLYDACGLTSVRPGAKSAQPAEPDDLTIAYMSGLADGKKAAQQKAKK